MKSVKRMGLLGAFVAVAAALGVSTFSGSLPTAQAQVPAGLTVTKTCTTTTVPPTGATPATCTITIANPTGGAIAIPETAGGVAVLVTVAAGNGATGTAGYGWVRILEGSSGATAPGGLADVDTVTISNVTGSPQTLAVGGSGTALDIAAGGSVVITIAEAGAVGGTTTESIQFGTGTAGTATLGTAVTLTPSVTVSAATTAASVTCVPVSINVGSGGTGSTCTLDFSDNDVFPTTVSSGTVTIAGTSLPAGTVLSAQSQTGNTLAGLRCPATGGTGLPQGCDSLTFNVISTTGSTVTGNVSVAVTYTPDLAGVNSPLAGVAFANIVSVIQPVAQYISPIGLTIVCTPVAAVTAFLPAPGPLAGVPGSPISVGVLGTSLPCEVRTQTDADAEAEAVASGTIEVSSINGTLISATGSLTTNLRIACGDPTVINFNPGVTIDPNNCLGVRFSVLGVGVGAVELRARYEPSTAAENAGVPERETAASVFFVAPNPCAGPAGVGGCSLLLNPNPVTVGQTGTATLRFGRQALECGLVICVDPATGQPIFFNAGSVINGNVVFTISDSLVASWVTAQPTATTPAPSSTSGFVTTANSTTVRCGFFPTVTLPSGAAGFTVGQPPLSQFFGGCEQATATYRGNAPGITAINAAFVADLPGAGIGFVSATTAAPSVLFPTQTPFNVTRALEVIGAAPVGDVQLARGCNNVSPTVSEAASAYAARVNPSGALVAIWEHQAATNTFRGWSPAAGAPNDLAAVTRLRPVFVCVSGPATLAQPPA